MRLFSRGPSAEPDEPEPIQVEESDSKPPHPFCAGCGGRMVLVRQQYVYYDRETGQPYQNLWWRCTNDVNPRPDPIKIGNVRHDYYNTDMTRGA